MVIAFARLSGRQRLMRMGLYALLIGLGALAFLAATAWFYPFWLGRAQAFYTGPISDERDGSNFPVAVHFTKGSQPRDTYIVYLADLARLRSQNVPFEPVIAMPRRIHSDTRLPSLGLDHHFFRPQVRFSRTEQGVHKPVVEVSAPWNEYQVVVSRYIVSGTTIHPLSLRGYFRPWVHAAAAFGAGLSGLFLYGLCLGAALALSNHQRVRNLGVVAGSVKTKMLLAGAAMWGSESCVRRTCFLVLLAVGPGWLCYLIVVYMGVPPGTYGDMPIIQRVLFMPASIIALLTVAVLIVGKVWVVTMALSAACLAISLVKVRTAGWSPTTVLMVVLAIAAHLSLLRYPAPP